MEKTKTTFGIAAVLAVMAVGLVLTSVTGSVHAQTNSAANNMTSAAKSMAGGAGNKTMGAANKTSEAANGTMTNATQGAAGNQTASNSTNPLAKVPIIGKLFGGK